MIFKKLNSPLKTDFLNKIHSPLTDCSASRNVQSNKDHVLVQIIFNPLHLVLATVKGNPIGNTCLKNCLTKFL